MKFLLFFMIIASISWWIGQRRAQSRANDLRMQILKRKQQVQQENFKRETDALNPHLKREE